MAWTPTTTDVAALLTARTTDNNGNEVGDFNATTRPTGTQTESLIARALGDVSSRSGTIPDGSLGGDALTVETAARTAATYRAAMLVELTFFPEQIDSDRSPYTELKALYDEAMAHLLDALTEYNSDGTIDPDSGNDVPDPSYGFPTDAGGMVGWGTNW